MPNTRTKQEKRTLYIILAAALAARLLLALITEGYTYDMSCFVAWGDKLASEGPAAFLQRRLFLRTTRPAISLCWGWSAWCAKRSS